MPIFSNIYTRSEGDYQIGGMTTFELESFLILLIIPEGKQKLSNEAGSVISVGGVFIIQEETIIFLNGNCVKVETCEKLLQFIFSFLAKLLLPYKTFPLQSFFLLQSFYLL